jgi:hypothetical protein
VKVSLLKKAVAPKVSKSESTYSKSCRRC